MELGRAEGGHQVKGLKAPALQFCKQGSGVGCGRGSWSHPWCGEGDREVCLPVLQPGRVHL